jgi:metal-sulfur cluster biosynthetic enzyme
LTAPGCGMGGVIAGDAQQKLLSLPGVGEAVVEIVWDPPWHHSMIKEQGRKILGLDLFQWLNNQGVVSSTLLVRLVPSR